MAKKKKKAKPKIELTPEEKAVPVQEAKPELSETPVIEGEQATAPVGNAMTADLGEAVTADLGKAMTTDIPTTPRPEVVKEPEPVELSVPVICAGCKATVESDTTRACPHCSGSLVFCPTCAKPGSCHKCGKALKE